VNRNSLSRLPSGVQGGTRTSHVPNKSWNGFLCRFQGVGPGVAESFMLLATALNLLFWISPWI